MDNFGSFLSTCLAIISIATLAGLGLLRGTVTNLREQLSDARNQNADLKSRLTDVEKDKDQFKTDLEAMKRVVTGEVHWIAISEQLEFHHEESRQHWSKDEDLLQRIHDILWERYNDA